MGKAFSKASNLSHELVTQKQAAARAEAALRESAAAAAAEADQREAALKAEVIKLQSSNRRLQTSCDKLASELEEVGGRGGRRGGCTTARQPGRTSTLCGEI